MNIRLWLDGYFYCVYFPSLLWDEHKGVMGMLMTGFEVKKVQRIKERWEAKVIVLLKSKRLVKIVRQLYEPRRAVEH